MSERRLELLEERFGALLEERSDGLRAADLAPIYRDDLTGFCRSELHFEPWAKQEEFFALAQRHVRVVWYGAIATGKDRALAALALHWYATRPNSLVVIVGASDRQVKEIDFVEIGRLFHEARLPGRLQQQALRGPDDNTIIGVVTTDEGRLRGLHAPGGVLFLISEGQSVPSWVYDAALRCTAGEGDKIIVVGNPTAAEGEFYRICTAPHWARLQVSAYDLLNSGRIIPGAISAAKVEEYERTFGRGSPKFIADILGQFPLDATEGLVPRSWCTAAAARWAAAPPPVRDAHTILSIDPARHGSDETAASVRQGNVVRVMTSWSGCDLMESVTRIERLGVEWGVTPEWCDRGNRNRRIKARGEVVVDCVGLGAGLKDRLHQLGYRTIEYNSGSKPSRSLTDGTDFLNLRAESYWLIREQLQAGTLCLPDDPKLFDELVSVTWEPTPQGKVKITEKDKLRDKLGRSPDRADSLAMSLIVGASHAPLGAMRMAGVF